MATITIDYTKPVVPVNADVAPICRLFMPNNSYVDTDPYAGTCYDTNIDGFGTWEGLADYLGRITHSPNVLIMFKAAVKAYENSEEGVGSVTFEEADPKMVEYYKELGIALAPYGFVVKGTESAGTDTDGQ